MSDTAPDGSPVELYAKLPALGEPELIHDAIPTGAEILELGAGAGRVTHGLLELGHPVVAVDNSAEMLAHVVGAETVRADIETLDLGRRFSVVLLCSDFVNVPDTANRRDLLAACARHVEPSGQVLLQGVPRDWEPSSEWSERGDVLLRLRRFEVEGALVSGEMEYVVDGRTLTHSFESKLVSDEELDADLAACGLRRVRTLDERGSWIEVAPIGS